MNNKKIKEEVKYFEISNLESLRKILKDKTKDEIIIMMNEMMSLDHEQFLCEKYSNIKKSK